MAYLRAAAAKDFRLKPKKMYQYTIDSEDGFESQMSPLTIDLRGFAPLACSADDGDCFPQFPVFLRQKKNTCMLWDSRLLT